MNKCALQPEPIRGCTLIRLTYINSQANTAVFVRQ